ncbi:hypothetical protein TOPH_00812 [Tolypocladium ophioglossoides CBS 100239]|uniref:Uncharacterized protein n=1 Tax=Tolypocladium ophioglossoides (strain CBS 100239) TaxID=1163406 RepID=A0A0L0NKE1_TOLOC|nr:hypothetical protein TOPH_00812 [Tolypocladium ophioglossoides CBS 100239]
MPRNALRSSVSRFTSTSWRYDESEMVLDMEESYDPCRSFHHRLNQQDNGDLGLRRRGVIADDGRGCGRACTEIVRRDHAPEGGFWRACSGSHTLKQIASTYWKAKGTGRDKDAWTAKGVLALHRLVLPTVQCRRHLDSEDAGQ